jgi:signal transduction histidine kinase
VGWLDSLFERSTTSRGQAQRVYSKTSIPIFWVVAMGGIAILLVTVGFLQYHWNAQIRKATEVRIGADLESVMMNWHLDLYGEFSAICIALQVGPDSGARDVWDDYLQRYEDWNRATKNSDSVENIFTNRDLVKNIYIWETSRSTNPRLLRLNPEQGRIDSVATPDDLRVLLSLLHDHSRTLRSALHAWQFDSSPREGNSESKGPLSPGQRLRSNAITGWQFDENIPAIVHPIFHHPEGKSENGEHLLHHSQGKSENGEPLTNSTPVDWIVIALDSNTIRNRIFPELTQRYFGGGQGLEYRLAVVAAGRTSHLLYSSDPEFGVREVSGSDSAMNIFGPPPESTEGSFWQTVKNRESVRGEEWHSFSGPIWFPLIEQTSQGGPWMLFVQHRTGPLQAAITKVWRGNMIIGGMVLLLLATSMILVVIASQRAQALANLQMDFVASISHELRTPLAAILSAGQNITDGFAPSFPVYGSIVTTQARQLIDLVDQILMFGSMKGGKKNYSFQLLQVADAIEDARKNFLALQGQTGFTLDVRVAETLPPVWGDRQALSRCLQNLIGNAAKYSGKSRWIGISADVFQTSKSHREVRINVADRGVGISTGELSRIFEPFYRSPQVLAAQIHGTGLGLSVARNIVEAMGGRVSVVSQVNAGSMFTVYLPVADEVHPAASTGSLETAMSR